MDLIVKSEASTDPSHGTPPDERTVEELLKRGVVNLDKLEGPTSHQVSAWVRDMLKLARAGHAGTLDPNVSGVLPIALERATAAAGALSEADKEYVCLMQVHGYLDGDRLGRVLERFRGEIFQTPPLKSAVKRRRRIRRIYELDVLETRGRYVLFRVGCEAGTYIRKLCSDVGRALGTGAHMQDLRRTRAGPFSEEDAVTLHDLRDAHVFHEEDGRETELRSAVLPFERMLDHLPSVLIRDSAVDAICHGADLAAPGVSMLQGFEKGDRVAILSLKGEGVAVARALVSSRDALEMEHGLVADTERVLMEPGTYPKGW
ncbi:MAG: putative tRNA pseudouridine synthase B [Methanonatronarchaeales archaeon]|nr:putative tRNA pseudouridine synthase B [Methanonatronarchaeales archaeon]